LPDNGPSRAAPPPGGEDARAEESRASGIERRRFPREEKPPEPPAPPSVLKPLRFTTRDLPADQQFSAWQAYMAPLVDVRLPDSVPPGTAFPADHAAWNLGGMLVVQQTAPAHSFLRQEAKVRSNLMDHWHVMVVRSGRTWTEVDGRVCHGEPGKVELRTLGHPFRGRATDAEILSLYLPRELLYLTSTEIKNNTTLSGTRTTLLIDYLDGLEAKLAQLSEADLPHVVQTVRDMILTCVSPSAADYPSAELPSLLPLKERVFRFVQANLTADDLTTERICRELGVSRTRLYQAFERDGGVHHFIQRRRLLSAHAALSDAANRQQIIDIAFAAGFSSAAHFSRAFSKEFGYAPREARHIAVPSYLGQAVEPISGVEGADSFDKWLRSLGHRQD